MINIRKTAFAPLYLVIMFFSPGMVEGQTNSIRLLVAASKTDLLNEPVRAIIEIPEQFLQVPVDEISVNVKEEGKDGKGAPGQLLPTENRDGGQSELWWIITEAKAGVSSSWIATLSHRETDDRSRFRWKDAPADHLDLLFDGRKVIRYMYAYDDSSPERLHETYKPFHHVFDTDGENLLTKGPGGLYTHHRGIFIGWNKLRFGGKQYDLWHMKETSQRHERFLQEKAGPVLARSESLIRWSQKDDVPIIEENRTTTVFRQPDPTVVLLEFQTKLKAVSGPVFLDGDPEHAGFQFRAHNDVSMGSERAKNRDQAGYEEIKARYLFHNEAVDPRQETDLPWVSMTFGLNNRHYTVQHMNHPQNPESTVHSAYRDYGRFGAFFKKRIEMGDTLTLRYRIWIVEGEVPKRSEMDAKYSAFSNGPEITVLQQIF